MPDKFIGTPRKATTHTNQNEDLIFEKSSPGKKAYRMAELDVPPSTPKSSSAPPYAQTLGVMPELSEIEIIRHFTRLSTWNYAIDLGMYPLGSCTMKYNGRVNELVSRLEGIAEAHPYQPESLSQGVLQIMKHPVRRAHRDHRHGHHHAPARRRRPRRVHRHPAGPRLPPGPGQPP